MPRALILGGTGLVGRAAARRLLRDSWQVDLTGRDPAHLPEDLTAEGVRFHAADRRDAAALRAVLGAGAELVVDCLCYTAEDAELLLELAPAADCTVMISSKAVYADSAGRHSNSAEPPRFEGPVSESQPTVPPGGGDPTSRSGYGANKVAAEQLLLDSGLAVSVLRPSKIHGQGAVRPREWVFVKRALDRRPALLLAHRGRGADHPSAAANIAALIEVVAARPGRRVLNSADPDAPNGLEISRAVARRVGHRWEEVLLPDETGGGLGAHPWDRNPPIVLDLTAAAALGYVAVGDYERTVAEEVDWLVSEARSGPHGARLPEGLDEAFFASAWDYPAEDRFLDHLHRTRGSPTAFVGPVSHA